MEGDPEAIGRALIAALDARRYEDAAQLLAPAAEWHNTSAFPGPETIAGAAAIAEFWRDLFESYRGDPATSSILVEAARASGDLVAISVHGYGEGTQSGVPIDQRWAHVIEVRDGSILRVDTYGTYEAALAAVG